MAFIDWFNPQPGTGALLDTRSESDQQKDYYTVEAYASAPVVRWVEKPFESLRSFPRQFQAVSNSCVAQTIKKLMGIGYYVANGTFIQLSASHVYQRRSNRPSGGMIGIEAFDIAGKGVTLEELAPSQNMNDAQMDSVKILPHYDAVGKLFAGGGHIGLPIGDIDSVARTIQESDGKGVMVWFYFTSREWSQKVPQVMDTLASPYDARSLRHSVSAVDFFLYNGKKAIKIEDSAPFGGISERIITEDFFRQRNFFSRYMINFKYEEVSPDPGPSITTVPHHRFSSTLKFIPLKPNGDIADTQLNTFQKKDVVALQEILKAEGFMPKNIESTGYYGSITAKGVLGFQKKYHVASDAELDSLLGRQVGPKTIAKLNELYGR